MNANTKQNSSKATVAGKTRKVATTSSSAQQAGGVTSTKAVPGRSKPQANAAKPLAAPAKPLATPAKPAKPRVLDAAGRVKAVDLALKVLRARHPEAGGVAPLSGKELDEITKQVGLVPYAQRQYVRQALREAGLHPIKGAHGDGRRVAVAALRKQSAGK